MPEPSVEGSSDEESVEELLARASRVAVEVGTGEVTEVTRFVREMIIEHMEVCPVCEGHSGAWALFHIRGLAGNAERPLDEEERRLVESTSELFDWYALETEFADRPFGREEREVVRQRIREHRATCTECTNGSAALRHVARLEGEK